MYSAVILLMSKYQNKWAKLFILKILMHAHILNHTPTHANVLSHTNTNSWHIIHLGVNVETETAAVLGRIVTATCWYHNINKNYSQPRNTGRIQFRPLDLIISLTHLNFTFKGNVAAKGKFWWNSFALIYSIHALRFVFIFLLKGTRIQRWNDMQRMFRCCRKSISQIGW